MKSRIILFLGVLLSGIALEESYLSEIMTKFSNVETFSTVLVLQATGSFLLIGGMITWAFLTFEKRKKKESVPLIKRKGEFAFITCFLIGLALLRNMNYASDWEELIIGTLLEELFILIFAFPTVAFFICFYPYLDGLKKAEQVGPHNSGHRSAKAST